MKLFKTVFALGAGVLGGLLFAQKPGKKLRSELSKSEKPLETLLAELKKVGTEVSDLAKNSEDLQKVLQSGKSQFESFVQAVGELGDEASESARAELENLSQNAKKAADDLKKTASKKAESAKKSVEKQVKKSSKVLEKKAKIVAKKIQK